MDRITTIALWVCLALLLGMKVAGADDLDAAELEARISDLEAKAARRYDRPRPRIATNWDRKTRDFDCVFGIKTEKECE